MERKLGTLVLVVLMLIAGLAVVEPCDAAKLHNDADTARWCALGAAYAPDYEAIAAVSSARWTALGQSYGAESKARVTDAARWNALGVAYAPDYEAIAAVSSARWTALGERYAQEVARGE